MRRTRVPARVVAPLFRQLADALRAGLPPRDTLAIIARDADLGRRHAQLVAHLRARLDAGEPLSAALEAWPGTFPPEAAAMLRAAEREDALQGALDLIATDYELRALHGMAVRGALAWPLSVAAVAFVVVAMVMVFVIPAFKEVFTSFGADLPAPTLLVMEVSDLFVQYWWLALLAVPLAYFWRQGPATLVRAQLDRVMMRVPFVRAYLVKTFLSRLSHVLASAADRRLPLAPALAYLRVTAGNRRLADIAAALEAQLAAGKDLAAAVRDTAHMPGQLTVALELGARSDDPALALRQIVTLSEGEAARSLVRLEQASLITMYLCLGVILGYVIIALYLPIFRLGAAI